MLTPFLVVHTGVPDISGCVYEKPADYKKKKTFCHAQKNPAARVWNKSSLLVFPCGAIFVSY